MFLLQHFAEHAEIVLLFEKSPKQKVLRSRVICYFESEESEYDDGRMQLGSRKCD